MTIINHDASIGLLKYQLHLKTYPTLSYLFSFNKQTYTVCVYISTKFKIQVENTKKILKKMTNKESLTF